MEVSLQLTPQGLALMFGSTVNPFTSWWHEAQLHITIQNPQNKYILHILHHTHAGTGRNIKKTLTQTNTHDSRSCTGIGVNCQSFHIMMTQSTITHRNTRPSHKHMLHHTHGNTGKIYFKIYDLKTKRGMLCVFLLNKFQLFPNLL